MAIDTIPYSGLFWISTYKIFTYDCSVTYPGKNADTFLAPGSAMFFVSDFDPGGWLILTSKGLVNVFNVGYL